MQLQRHCSSGAPHTALTYLAPARARSVVEGMLLEVGGLYLPSQVRGRPCF